MVNTQLLEDKIRKSGYKKDFLCEQLGITRQGFYKKLNGKSAFRAAEVYVLCNFLNITEDEKKAIFLPSE